MPNIPVLFRETILFYVVSDNGYGIDKQTMENLFEPFFTTKDRAKGTGLGMATVYGIVQQNNGFINVYSEPDQGTTCKIYLPGHKIEADPIVMEEQGMIEARGNETILLVTDVVMPNMNGRDLARELQSIYPTLKNLFMSGYTANVIAHRGILDEGIHFIQKPFSRNDLAVKLRKALDVTMN